MVLYLSYCEFMANSSKYLRVMIFPALFDHVGLIQKAKSRGCVVITCDNQPDNVGHKHSDHYSEISLLDYSKLIAEAKEYNINGVLSFSTDIGAVPASIIAKELGLPGSNPAAVEIMAHKGKFRSFLKKYNYAFPDCQVVRCVGEFVLTDLSFPLVIKPTDRAGSKGVFLIQSKEDLIQYFPLSMSFSIEKKVILEKYIQTEYNQIHGDAVVKDGKIIFLCLGDQYFGTGELKFSPIATSFPSSIPDSIFDEIKRQLQKIITGLNYNQGGLNIELRIGVDGEIYFIEIAPRFGGNLIAKTISYACNVDLEAYALDMSMGVDINKPDYRIDPTIFQLILRSDKDGYLKHLHVKNSNFNILEKQVIKNCGDPICSENGPQSIIAVFILKAKSEQDKMDIIGNCYKYFVIETLD